MLPSQLRLTALAAPLLLPLVACGGDGSSTDGSTGSAGSSTPSADTEEVGATELSEVEIEAAIAVYESATCWTCHGRPHADMEGLAGPALSNLDEHWNVDDLADFIDDPEAWVAKDDRLAVMKSEYPLPMMKTMRPVSLEDRQLLASWLLTLE